jgi:ribA/ribD-fused uncharacterized protein
MTDSQVESAPIVISRFSGPFAYLNNFHQAVVTIDGIDYPSGEHAFHAQKTEDAAARWRIAKASTSAEAKRLGRAVVLVDGWNEYLRYEAMERVIEAKFYPGRSLSDRLCETGDAVLIEGNTWHDNTWGICSCGRCKGGHNLLGWMLMRRRAYLMEA